MISQPEPLEFLEYYPYKNSDEFEEYKYLAYTANPLWHSPEILQEGISKRGFDPLMLSNPSIFTVDETQYNNLLKETYDSVFERACI